LTVLEIWFLALALAVDAFIVSFSYGLVINKDRFSSSLKISGATALGQSIMPILGWYGAKSIYHQVEQVDHWIAFAVFSFLGIKVIVDSIKDEEKHQSSGKQKISLRELFLIGVGTSIDAFVSGSLLFFVKSDLCNSVIIIGTTTFICSLVGFNLCRIFKKFSHQPMEVASGIILIGLGCKILVDHLFL